jgi:hypothetical protein
MTILLTTAKIWLALSLAIPVVIAYRRNPLIRHRLFRITVGGMSPPRDRWQAHLLVAAARHATPHWRH